MYVGGTLETMRKHWREVHAFSRSLLNELRRVVLEGPHLTKRGRRRYCKEGDLNGVAKDLLHDLWSEYRGGI